MAEIKSALPSDSSLYHDIEVGRIGDSTDSEHKASKVADSDETHANSDTDEGQEEAEEEVDTDEEENEEKNENENCRTSTNENEGQQQTSTSNKFCCKRTTLAFILIALVLFVIIDATLGHGRIGDGIMSFLKWMEQHPVPGFFIFVLVYGLATVFLVPASLLTVGAGFGFGSAFGLGPGLLVGSFAVFLGASTGALVSFLMGRFLLRQSVTAMTARYAIFEALDNALARKGFRIMVLLRLSPVMPFNVLNYILGITAVGLSQYVLSLLAIVPGVVLFVFLGASAGSLAHSMQEDSEESDMTVTKLVVILAGVVLSILAVGLTSYYAKKELREITEQRSSTLRLEPGSLDSESPTTSEDPVER